MAAPALRPPQRGWSDRSRHGRAPCGARGPQPECEPRHREPGASAQGGRRQGADHRRRDRRCVAATRGAGLRRVLTGHVYGLGAASGPCCQPIRSRRACQPESGRTAPTKRTSPMTTHDQTFSTAFAPSKPAESFASWIKSVGGRIATWVDTCADHYAAATMYEQLSALSDAELMRRDLSRATLARHVLAACDRVSNPAMASKARARCPACST